MAKIYYGKKSKNLSIYIICFIISAIIGVIIKGNIGIYISIILIISLPLFALFLNDHIKSNKLKIELDNNKLKIRKENGEKIEISYKEILMIYNILYSSINIINNYQIIQIVNKSGYIVTEINTIYMEHINNFLQELYKKGIIICEIQIKDSKTSDINNKKATYRVIPPVTIGHMPLIHEEYAVTRDIIKSYRGVPENETEQFEKKHNLTNFTIKD